MGESDDKEKETSDIGALPDLEQTLLFCFENCDAMGQMRIIQLAMNEHDRTQKEKQALRKSLLSAKVIELDKWRKTL